MLGVPHGVPSSDDCGTQSAGRSQVCWAVADRGGRGEPSRPASHRSVMPIDLIFHANNAIYRV